MLVIDTVTHRIEYREVEGQNNIIEFPARMPLLKSEMASPAKQAIAEVKKYIYFRLEVKDTKQLQKYAKAAGMQLNLRLKATWLELKGELGTQLKNFILKNKKRFADVKDIYKYRRRGGNLQEQIPEIPVVLSARQTEGSTETLVEQASEVLADTGAQTEVAEPEVLATEVTEGGAFGVGDIVELPTKTPHGMNEVGTVMQIADMILVRRPSGHLNLYHAQNLRLIAKG